MLVKWSTAVDIKPIFFWKLKEKDMDMAGIEPGTLRMVVGRANHWATKFNFSRKVLGIYIDS